MKDNPNLIKGFIASAFLFVFIIAVFWDTDKVLFSDSFFWNLICTPLCILGIGLAGATVLTLPTIGILLFLDKLEDDFAWDSEKTPKIIFCVVIALLWIGLALFATYINRGR